MGASDMRFTHQALAAAGAVIALVLSGASGAAVGSTAPSSQSGAAGQASAASTRGTVKTGSIVRFNVAATHSPELEHMLAGRPGASPRAASRPAGLSAAASTVQGVDVSSAQHPNGAAINWGEVANTDGYKFAFVKVSEGSYYVNPYYAADAAGAQSAGMFVAPYAFAIPNYSGGALQADYALDNSGYAADGRMLPPILDIEYDPYAAEDGTNECYGLTDAEMVAWISAFSAEMQRRTGQHPVIYTTSGWWDTCTGDSTALAADPLWIANYEVSSPAVPAAWSTWAYWQYTSSATVPGISGSNGNTDTSYLSSTALELAAPASQSNRVGTAVSLPLNALTAAPAVTYSATGLPPGTQIAAVTGAVSGTLPATPASFPVVVTAAAGGDPSATQAFSWYVHRRVTLARMASQAATIGAPVRYQVRAKDGLSGCTLQFSASGLPPGLADSSCGMISGWPARAGSYTITVRATDSSGATVAQGSLGWKVTRATGRGPGGHIQLERNGKCLAERSPIVIGIQTCSRTATDEDWTIAADGSLRIRDRCLAPESATGAAAAALDITSCTGAQRWELRSNAVLVYVSSGRCLADTGNRNGARAVAAVCQATSNATGSASTPSQSQQWTLPAGPLTSDIAGYCASSLHPAAGPSNAVTLRSCATSASQNWMLEPDGALSAGGKCLRTVGASASTGTLLHLGSCAPGTPGQVWLLAGGPIGVQLVNPAVGLCVADPDDLASAGETLRLGPCVAGDPGTWWRVS